MNAVVPVEARNLSRFILPFFISPSVLDAILSSSIDDKRGLELELLVSEDCQVEN
ncbi:MAG: hypothetical protein M3297_10435 [Thermoproteota archaeon]|nr:hypothetical protein [Thermoproteota archaeon]